MRIAAEPLMVQWFHANTKRLFGAAPSTPARALLVTKSRSSQNGATSPLGSAALGIATLSLLELGVPVVPVQSCAKPFDVIDQPPAGAPKKLNAKGSAEIVDAALSERMPGTFAVSGRSSHAAVIATGVAYGGTTVVSPPVSEGEESVPPSAGASEATVVSVGDVVSVPPPSGDTAESFPVSVDDVASAAVQIWATQSSPGLHVPLP